MFFSPNIVENDYETDRDLPSYTVDANGFIIFDDKRLGGVAILEVTPKLPSQAFIEKQEDEFFITPNKNIGPQATITREDAIHEWVLLLNSLHSDEENNLSEDPIHIQVIIKKVLSDEWETETEYQMDKLKNKTIKNLNTMPMTQTKKEKMKTKIRDYYGLLKSLNNEEKRINEANLLNDNRAYDYKYYIVISYTPSSEGWWYDGRDVDYYLHDDSSPTNLFFTDTIVEKIGKRKQEKLEARMEETETNTANMIFPIRTDLIVSMLETRLRKIEHALHEYEKNNPDKDITFTIKRNTQFDTSCLIAFYNKLLSPYVEKAHKLSPSYNDLLYRIQTETALKTNNPDLLPTSMTMTTANKQDETEFLNQYKGKTLQENRNKNQNLIKPSTPHNNLNKQQESLWADMQKENQTEKLTNEEAFLSKYKGRTVTKSLKNNYQANIDSHGELQNQRGITLSHSNKHINNNEVPTIEPNSIELHDENINQSVPTNKQKKNFIVTPEHLKTQIPSPFINNDNKNNRN